MWRYKTYGIPDELFYRDERVPITKEEVRCIALSKARLNEGDVVIDIGCGTGSITVEAGLIVGSKGKVYAIDKDIEAINLTKKNVQLFGLSNVEIIHDQAEVVLDLLPNADAIFIGGTGGNTYKIVEKAYNKLKYGKRMVVDTILIESTYNALEALKGAKVEVVQVIINKGKNVGIGNMLIARNPVTIIIAEK